MDFGYILVFNHLVNYYFGFVLFWFLNIRTIAPPADQPSAKYRITTLSKYLNPRPDLNPLPI